MRRLQRWLLCALLAVLPGVQAQDLGTTADGEPDLYEEAMQAINEGRRSDASRTLARMIAQGPHHAAEWMDLAMVLCALGHAEEAEQQFQAIERRFDPPPGIRDLIAQQRARGCAPAVRHSQWSLLTARGFDHNVNQGASNPLYSLGSDGEPLTLLPEYLPHKDHYSVLSADYISDLSQNGDLGFLQLQVHQNDHLSRYNTVALSAGADHPWRYKRWRFRATGVVSLLTLGGKLYQEQALGQLRATWTASPHWDVTAMLGQSHARFRTLSNFDANTSELRTLASYRSERWFGQLSSGLQYDHAVANRPGGNRQGWSSGLYARTRLWDKVEGELDLSSQHWRGEQAYAPGVIELHRRQDNRQLRLVLSRPLTPRSSVQLEWRAIQNRENISLFEYDNRILQLSWRWQDGR
jgi:hypothetical protein